MSRDEQVMQDSKSSFGGWGLAAATGIFACLAIKMLVNVQPIPFWGGTDPMREVVIDVGLKPSQLMILDATVLICSAILIALGMHLGKQAISRLWMLAAGLCVIGCGWIVYGITRGAHDPTIFEQEMMASSWLSGMAAMLGLWRAGSQASVRWLGIAAFGSVCLGLVIKGGVQIFIEHPEMLRNFKANREAIFAANGWLPDSAAARGYERRIMQPEASGFTGFSNVTASFVLAGLAGLSGLFLATVLGMRQRMRTDPSRTGWWRVWVLMFASMACGLGVVWTGSKAGLVLAIGGTALSLLGIWLLSRAWEQGDARNESSLLAKLATWMPLGLSAGVVLAVIARGLIGERLGELSVLFRWHYLIGSVRAFLTDPIAGVGIDGFQGVYARVKVPFSPEDVSSPHFQLAEWAAVLGIGGVAMGAAVISALLASGRGVRQFLKQDDAPIVDFTQYLGVPDRWMMRSAVLMAAVVTLISLHVMREALTGSELLLRMGVLLGLVLSVKFVVGLMEVAAEFAWLAWLDRAGKFALVIIAGLLVAHSQFELTGTNMQSAGLVLAMLGLAAGSTSGRFKNGPQRAGNLARMGSAAVLAGCAMGCVLVQQAFSTMERQLETSARAWSDVREVRGWFEQALAKRDPQARELQANLIDASTKAIKSHGQMADGRWWLNPRGYWPVARSSSQSLMVMARQYHQYGLQASAAGQPEAAAIWQARSAWLLVAAERAVLVPYDLASVNEAIAEATSGGRAVPAMASDQVFEAGRTENVTRLAWLSAVYEEWARLSQDQATIQRAWDRALAVSQRAAELEPYAMAPAMKAMRLAKGMGQESVAKKWAAAVLKRNELQRLDAQVRGLSQAERGEVDRVLEGR
jgi:hypothetical protein